MKPPRSSSTRKKNIFLALLIFVTAISIFGFSKKVRDAPDNDLASVKHYIDKGVCPGIGISNARLRTKFVDDKLLYIISLKVGKGKKKEMPHSFTIKLIDKDGFDVQYFTINSSFFTEELDTSENLVGYSYQSIELIDADKYQSIAGWNLIWASK